MRKPILYILAGRSFAGKSTLRKELVKRLNFSVASVDWTIGNYGYEVKSMTQKDWDLVYSETYEKLKQLLREGKITILDLGNLKKSERNAARKIAEELSVPYKLIYINTDEEEVRKRWNKNKLTNKGRQMDEEVFNRAQNMFEDLTEDENHIEYNHKMDLDSWIRENIN